MSTSNIILVDAVFINNGGGKVLLDYLLSKTLEENASFHYLLDKRIKNNHPELPSNTVTYLRGSFLDRLLYYLKNRNKYKSVFCFSNIPPPVKLNNSQVTTYFHNVLIVDVKKYTSPILTWKVRIRKILWMYLSVNSDRWIVQTNAVKNKLSDLLYLDDDRILIMPFFHLPEYSKTSQCDKNGYVYVSSNAPHKNQLNLLKAWEHLFDRGIKPLLNLTIPEGDDELNVYIKRLKDKGVQIVNHGVLDKTQVNQLYSQSKFLIYPSSAESFGLPLVEAVHFGCNVISSNLAYVREVIIPSANFNHDDYKSISNSVLESIELDLPNSKIVVQDQVNDLIKLILRH